MPTSSSTTRPRIGAPVLPGTPHEQLLQHHGFPQHAHGGQGRGGALLRLRLLRGGLRAPARGAHRGGRPSKPLLTLRRRQAGERTLRLGAFRRHEGHRPPVHERLRAEAGSGEPLLGSHNNPVPVHTGGKRRWSTATETTRDFIYVDDVVQANILAALRRIQAVPFNIGTGGPCR